MMKLVEECSGRGELLLDAESPREVQYNILRYQGMTEGSGLPVPGLFRIEGSIDLQSSPVSSDWIDVPLTLRLNDGRALRIVVSDSSGRVFSEGHGPSRCLCC